MVDTDLDWCSSLPEIGAEVFSVEVVAEALLTAGSGRGDLLLIDVVSADETDSFFLP